MGFWMHSLAAGLLRRWLAYYGLYSAMLRLISLQAICWPLSHVIIRHFPGSTTCPLLGWATASSMSSLANSIRLWVTSNLDSSSSPYGSSALKRLYYKSTQSSSSTSAASAATSLSSTSSSSSSSNTSKNNNNDLVLTNGKGRQLSFQELLAKTIFPLAGLAFLTLPALMLEHLRWKAFFYNALYTTTATTAIAPSSSSPTFQLCQLSCLD